MMTLNDVQGHMVCSHCGSKNVEVTSSLPKENEGFFSKMLRKLSDRNYRIGPLAGRMFVVCHDCGYIAMLQS